MAGFLAKLTALRNPTEDAAVFTQSLPLSYAHESSIVQHVEAFNEKTGLAQLANLREMPKLSFRAVALPNHNAVVFGSQLLKAPEPVLQGTLALEMAHNVYGNNAEDKTEFFRDMRFAKFAMGDDAPVREALRYYDAMERQVLRETTTQFLQHTDTETILSRIDLRYISMSRNEKLLDAPITDKEKAEFTHAIAAYNQRCAEQQADRGRGR